MCHRCRAYECPGCLPCCDECGRETHAAYDALTDARLCEDCSAESETVCVEGDAWLAERAAMDRVALVGLTASAVAL